MGRDGWYIAPWRPTTGYRAGHWAWGVFLNGEPQQGFRLYNALGVLTWGPANGKGWLPWRLR